jgi:hypothetical protein
LWLAATLALVRQGVPFVWMGCELSKGQEKEMGIVLQHIWGPKIGCTSEWPGQLLDGKMVMSLRYQFSAKAIRSLCKLDDCAACQAVTNLHSILPDKNRRDMGFGHVKSDTPWPHRPCLGPMPYQEMQQNQEILRLLRPQLLLLGQDLPSELTQLLRHGCRQLVLEKAQVLLEDGPLTLANYSK